MTNLKIVTVSFQETKASWEIINRRVDGLVFGELFIPNKQAQKNKQQKKARRKSSLKSNKINITSTR